MKSLVKFLSQLNQPSYLKNYASDLAFALSRIIAGLLLTLDFGSSKFGLPWSNGSEELGLFQVASWFPADVANFGFPFDLAPHFFAWMGAASEAIGGFLLVLGLFTRFSSFLVACTMLVAIFFQKWGGGTWGMLPAMGFLWVAIQGMVLGSGRFGLDHLLTKLNWKSIVKTRTAIAFLALSLALSSCANYANVSVPASQEFLLGENEKGSFRAKLTNNGPVEVFIKTIDTQTREQLSGFGLPAGSTQTIYVGANETAVIVNANGEEALVKAKLYESVEGMRYQVLDGGED